MTDWRLIARSIRHYAPGHWPVVLATAVCSAVITGALLVGDSVRGSLLRLVRQRLGQTTFAVLCGDRLVRTDIGTRLSGLGVHTSTVLTLPAVASVPGTELRLNHISVMGIDPDFAALAAAGQFAAPQGETATICRVVADRLALSPGDTLLLRIEKVTALPRGTPLAGADADSVALRLTVGAIAEDDALGRFSLRANHVPPANVFVSRQTLCSVLEVGERCNLVLLAGNGTLTAEGVHKALAAAWEPDDVGLEIVARPDGGTEMSSRRVFIDSNVAALAATRPGAESFLTYFVNEFRHGERATPYSFISGTDSALLPMPLGEDGILINGWLAADLGCVVGDRLTVTYFVMGSMGALETRRVDLTVRGICPLTSPLSDASLMPAIPGLADAGSCTEWTPGIPIDLERIRDKDEAYWDAYKGTPKAFVSLGTARRLWANRFGDTTAVRIPGSAAAELAADLRSRVKPERVGLQVEAVLADGQRASTESVDFAQLFLGLSFFLIAAALTLTGLLFALSAEGRRDQIATLLALGFTPRRVRGYLYVEGLVVALPGITLGVLLGILYNRLIIVALTGIWAGSVGAAALVPCVTLSSLLIGWGSSLGVAWLTFWLVIRRLSTRSVQSLRASAGGLPHPKRRRWALVCGILATGLGLALAVCGEPGRGHAAAGTFFSAGALLLTGSLCLADAFLGLSMVFKTGGLSLRNASRRRGRSLAVIAVLACALFLIVAVGANRHSPSKADAGPSSGTGGFALYAETSLPLQLDLNTVAGQEKAGLDPAVTAGLSVVRMTLSDGDDASCLNLNRSARPRILGVAPHELAERGAFSFTQAMDGLDLGQGWNLLNTKRPDGAVPAIADSTVIIWGLGVKVGDAITVQDSKGQAVDLVFVAGTANSILQGSVVISSEHFQRLFPGEDGARVMLIDAPVAHSEDLRKQLTDGLSDVGFSASGSIERLATFNAVENTYLAIFLALGGLALVLGSAGLAAVVIRNVSERRGELALLRALGFSRHSVVRMVVVEHAALLLVGLVAGTVGGIIAVLPALRGPGGDGDLGGVSSWTIAVTITGMFWIILAAVHATRGDLLAGLRDE